MVGLEFDGFGVKTGEELFGELQFAHVCFGKALSFKAPKVMEEGECCQIDLVVAGSWCCLSSADNGGMRAGLGCTGALQLWKREYYRVLSSQ